MSESDRWISHKEGPSASHIQLVLQYN